MAEYAKSAETKRKILDACKMLFYEKGYVATRYTDISELSGINEGLIYYHFKKKDALGGIIFEEVISDVISQAEKLTENSKTLMLAAGVNCRILWRLTYTSEVFKRFNQELILNRIPNTVGRESDAAWYRAYNERYRLGLSPTDLRLISFAHNAMESELILAMIEGKLDLTEKQFADFDIRTELELFKIDFNSIEAVIRESTALCNSVEIRMSDGFQVELIT